MKYVIYGAPGTGSGIIEAACAELGVAYEVRDLDARNGEHRGEAYAAINPHRKMPAVEVIDGDRREVLTESVAILVTLDERHPEAGLLPPTGSPERAQALRWIVFLATEIYPLVEWTDYPERIAVRAEDADAIRARVDEMTRARWRLVEAGVRGSPWLLERGFSAADLYITKLVVWLDREWRRAELPKVDALTSATLARPRLAGVWKRHVRP